MISSPVLSKYKIERRKGYGAGLALSIARESVAPIGSERYPFLADLDNGLSPVEGTAGSLTIRVSVVLDDETRPGGDDVTGWFTDTFEPGCVKNTRRDWRSDATWYRPCNDTQENGFANMRAAGMSKAVAREAYAAQVDREMAADSERQYYGVVVTVSVDGVELASESLWGIDAVSEYDPVPYFIETAEDLIDVALKAARAAIPKQIARLESLVAVLQSEVRR